MAAITSAAYVCNVCGDTYEIDSYSNDFLDSLTRQEHEGCGGRYFYNSVSDRFEAEGMYWCRERGCYCKPRSRGRRGWKEEEEEGTET